WKVYFVFDQVRRTRHKLTEIYSSNRLSRSADVQRQNSCGKQLLWLVLASSEFDRPWGWKPHSRPAGDIQTTPKTTSERRLTRLSFPGAVHLGCLKRPNIHTGVQNPPHQPVLRTVHSATQQGFHPGESCARFLVRLHLHATSAAKTAACLRRRIFSPRCSDLHPRMSSLIDPVVGHVPRVKWALTYEVNHLMTGTPFAEYYRYVQMLHLVKANDDPGMLCISIFIVHGDISGQHVLNVNDDIIVLGNDFSNLRSVLDPCAAVREGQPVAVVLARGTGWAMLLVWISRPVVLCS